MTKSNRGEEGCLTFPNHSPSHKEVRTGAQVGVSQEAGRDHEGKHLVSRLTSSCPYTALTSCAGMV